MLFPSGRFVCAGCLDGLLCIAVLHHISSEARRVRLLAELARVLRPGACALVTVWASAQEEPGKLAKWERMPGQGQPANPYGPIDGMAQICLLDMLLLPDIF